MNDPTWKLLDQVNGHLADAVNGLTDVDLGSIEDASPTHAEMLGDALAAIEQAQRLIQTVQSQAEADVERGAPLTRHDRLQRAADNGRDTWGDYNGDR